MFRRANLTPERGNWRRPEFRDAEDLIDREREAEHEVAFDLDGAAHTDEPRAASGSGMRMSFMRSTSRAHSALASCWARKLRSMIGIWPSGFAWS